MADTRHPSIGNAVRCPGCIMMVRQIESLKSMNKVSSIGNRLIQYESTNIYLVELVDLIIMVYLHLYICVVGF